MTTCSLLIYYYSARKYYFCIQVRELFLFENFFFNIFVLVLSYKQQTGSVFSDLYILIYIECVKINKLAINPYYCVWSQNGNFLQWAHLKVELVYINVWASSG